MKSARQKLDVKRGASLRAIARLEKLLGTQLPDDIRESLKIHDGGYWWVLPNFGELLPVGEIERQWSMYRDWQQEGTYGNDSSNWEAEDIHGPIKPIFWNVKRIPITDNSGDHLMLDLDPPGDGTYGQIIDHSHEVGPKRVVAASWSEFLANLVDDLESGKYDLDEEGKLKHVNGS